ncbi:aminotransferase class III-fold pyridoxal phosphate-dependent enzyme, partial [Rhodococcus triatomae]
WSPGEHNGTFRGNNPAFVTATAALEQYWADDRLQVSTAAKGRRIGEIFANLSDSFDGVSTRGRGMVQGLVFDDPGKAVKVCGLAFDEGLLAETSGPSDEVVKLLPPLTITHDELNHGLSILAEATAKVCA